VAHVMGHAEGATCLFDARVLQLLQMLYRFRYMRNDIRSSFPLRALPQLRPR
jgi:hypothetical protein